MKKTTKPKKRNPQDSTRRNVQAANKRIKHLETCYRFLDEMVVELQTQLRNQIYREGLLIKRLDRIEKQKGRKS